MSESEEEKRSRLAAMAKSDPGDVSLLAARKLIDAYESLHQVREMNRGEGSRMVAVDVLREAKREWDALRR